jgi:hypothetical protein
LHSASCVGIEETANEMASNEKYIVVAGLNTISIVAKRRRT